MSEPVKYEILKCPECGHDLKVQFAWPKTGIMPKRVFVCPTHGNYEQAPGAAS